MISLILERLRDPPDAGRGAPPYVRDRPPSGGREKGGVMKGLLLSIAATLGVTATLAAPAGTGEWVTERYTTLETWHSFADVGRPNPGTGGPGDIYVSQLRVTTPDGEKVGVANGVMVDLKPPFIASHWTAALPQGTLTLEGVTSEARGAGTQRLVITGGTGRYEAARGTLAATDAGANRAYVVLRYRR